MTRQPSRMVIPAVDLGGTKIALSFVKTGKKRVAAKHFPPMKIVKTRGQTDAAKTLKRVAGLIKKSAREMEKEGWTVLRLVGMGAPGLYREDGSVDPASVPNIPDLAEMNPAGFLERLLGNEWLVFVQNDGALQALAAAHFFAHSPEFVSKWSRHMKDAGGRIVYIGPGTGFGAGKVQVGPDGHVALIPGSQAFFDILLRKGKTAEDLLGGRGMGNIARELENRRLKKGRPALLKFVPGFPPDADYDKNSLADFLDRITAKTAAEAFYSTDAQAKSLARKLFETAGQDLADLMIKIFEGKIRKTVLPWGKNDRLSVKGAGIFIAAGLLVKPVGKTLILPSAKAALKNKGYEKKIHVAELDSFFPIKKATGKIGIYGASLMVPEKEIRKQIWAASLVSGNRQIHRFIGERIRELHQKHPRSVLLAMDGYAGVAWEKCASLLKRFLEQEGIALTTIDATEFYKTTEEIDRIIDSCMAGGKTFGRLYSGKLVDLTDENRVGRAKAKLEAARTGTSPSPSAILCYGPGAACRDLAHLYDLIIYRDLTREEINRRSKKGLLVPLGAEKKRRPGGNQPGYLAGKRFHYVDYPLLDRHRKSLKKKIDFYIDDNTASRPRMIGGKIYNEMINALSRGPFQLKAYHDEGVWGGQWLKKVRDLPEGMVNCAWAYELMAYHMSVKIPVGETFIETPFANLLDREADGIMGESVTKTFKGVWPIRVNYDDCWKGDDMAIQIHPDAAYIKKSFAELLHQDESYYIVHAEPDAYVYLGLKEDVDIDAFRKKVLDAETRGIPFDHRRFVNVFPAGEGDLFLLPAGTIHASGRGCVVLELSSTTDRYTFHFYDYLRPDLHGSLRDIHSTHAFHMLGKYPDRRTGWVKKHLMQKPKLIRKEKGFSEYLIGRLDSYIPEIHRYVIRTSAADSTDGVFHVLSLVKGRKAVIAPAGGSRDEFELKFSQTVILPACLGAYRIINRDEAACTVLKTTVNRSWLDW